MTFQIRAGAGASALRALAAAAALLLATFFVAPATAQFVNPTASAVQEQQLLQALGRGGSVQGRVSIPDAAAAPLIKPAGQQWRGFHQGTMFWVGAIALLAVVVALGAYYLYRGRIALSSGLSGVKIVRFNSFERFTHWLTATSFIVLALTGLNIVFGRYLLLPLFGAEAFAAATLLGKYAHNYLALPFAIGVVLMLIVWVKDNVPSRLDIEWIRVGGGLFSRGGHHPPARKFNAGQKGIFWSVILGGAALVVTGVFLLFPAVAGSYANWQLAQMIHGLVSVALIAIMLGHIYIGSIGMEGAFDAMGSGEVDYAWAREHHSLWAEEARVGQGAAKPIEVPPTVVPAE